MKEPSEETFEKVVALRSPPSSAEVFHAAERSSRTLSPTSNLKIALFQASFLKGPAAKELYRERVGSSSLNSCPTNLSKLELSMVPRRMFVPGTFMSLCA